MAKTPQSERARKNDWQRRQRHPSTSSTRGLLRLIAMAEVLEASKRWRVNSRGRWVPARSIPAS